MSALNIRPALLPALHWLMANAALAPVALAFAP
jgi:hypothetical protein